jgi:hypothetical protein
MNTTGVLPEAFARSTSSASVTVVVLDMFLLVISHARRLGRAVARRA